MDEENKRIGSRSGGPLLQAVLTSDVPVWLQQTPFIRQKPVHPTRTGEHPATDCGARECLFIVLFKQSLLRRFPNCTIQPCLSKNFVAKMR
jgi:hypothetical protein